MSDRRKDMGRRAEGCRDTTAAYDHDNHGSDDDNYAGGGR